MKDVDGMKKIRNWIRELQNKVAEEQMPPRYRDFTPEQWEEERTAVQKELQNLPETEGDSLEDIVRFLEKHRDFFKALEIRKRRAMRKNLHDIEYKI